LKKENENQNSYSVPENLKNYYMIFENRLNKIYFLFEFLKKNNKGKILIFFNTCKSVDFYGNLLEEYLS